MGAIKLSRWCRETPRPKPLDDTVKIAKTGNSNGNFDVAFPGPSPALLPTYIYQFWWADRRSMSACAPLDRSLRLRQNLAGAAMSCPSIYCPLPIIDVQCLHCVSICHTQVVLLYRKERPSSWPWWRHLQLPPRLLVLSSFFFFFTDSIQSTSELFYFFFFLLEFAHVQHMCNWLALSNMFDCKRITSVYPSRKVPLLHFYFTFFYYEIETSGSHNHLTLTSSALAGSFFSPPSMTGERGEWKGG